MSLEYFHVHLPKWLSPVVILVLLTGGSAASVYRSRQLASKARSSQTAEELTVTEEAGLAATAAAIVGNALV